MILRTLGDLTLEGAGFRRPKPLLLLAYLAAEGPTERRFLAELFWPRAANARRSLSTALTQVRGGAPKVVGADDVRIWCNVESDAVQLIRAVENQDWLRAVELYRGDFLEGVEVSREGVELEEWAYGTREKLAHAVRSALLALGEQAASADSFAEAGIWAGRAHALSRTAVPESRDLGRLYRLLLASGRPDVAEVRSDALALGLDVPSTVEEAQSSFHAKLSPVGPRHLPIRKTAFVGRQRELSTLGGLLADGRYRLVSLVGPGGAGKTRLALELAHQQSELGTWHGVHFVALESLTNAGHVAPALGDALGLRLQGGEEVVPQLQRAIGDSACLIVLDNFEQLSAAAPLLSDFVQACPNVRLVVTSREVLGLTIEVPVLLGGLAVPGTANVQVEDAIRSDAVALFVERARQVRPDFVLQDASVDAVLRVCRHVGGLPLAIEMAAAWVRAMSCTEIADELKTSLHLLESHRRDVPERHHSIRVVFEQSWRFLTRDEQRVSHALAVFRGGFSREAAATVAGASASELAALVDRSLLSWDGLGRYLLHPLLRRFLEEMARLEPTRYVDAQDRHARHFLGRLEALEATFPRRGSASAAAEIEADLPNHLAAWEWAAREGRSALLENATHALGSFFFRRGRALEGRDWSEYPVSGTPSRLLEVRRGVWQGTFLNHLGSREVAMERVQRSLRLAEQLDAIPDQAFALRIAGFISPKQDDSDVANATHAYRRAYELYDELDDVEGKAMMLNNLAGLCEDLRQAWEMLEHARRIARDAGETHALAMASGTLVDYLVFLPGDYLGARRAAEESVAGHQVTGASLYAAGSLINLGEVLVTLGDLDGAETEAKRALVLADAFHASAAWKIRGGAYALLGTIDRVRGHLDAATDRYREALRHLESSPRKRDAAWWTGTAWNGLTRAALAGGRPQEARRYADQATAHVTSCGWSHGLALTTLRLTALTQLGEALALQGEFEDAELQLQTALREAWGEQRIPATLEALVALAELGRMRGTCERASEIFGMVAMHAASSHELVQRARQRSSDLRPPLFPPQTHRIDMADAVAIVMRRDSGNEGRARLGPRGTNSDGG